MLSAEAVLNVECRSRAKYRFWNAGELFKPTSNAFAELWLDGKQATTVEYFRKDLVEGTTGVNHIPPLATTLEELDGRIQVRHQTPLTRHQTPLTTT